MALSQQSPPIDEREDRPDNLHEAMDVYFTAKARMFAGISSFALRRVGPLACFHNHPGWPEVDGFYAVDGETATDEVVSAVRAYQPTMEHMITIFTASPQSLVPPYAERGYEALPDPQPFMSKRLTNPIAPVSAPASPVSIEDAPDVSRVETKAQFDFLNSYKPEPVMEPEHLNDPLYRYYYIEHDNKPVCWGRCIMAMPEAIYVAGMETLPDYRRRGLATALMNRIHADAERSGAKQSILCSTVLGFGLYSKVGYHTVRYMQAFVPQVSPNRNLY